MLLAEELSKFADDKILYLKIEPEIHDFTRPFGGKLLIYGQKALLTADFPDRSDIANFLHQILGMTKDKTVIFWNVKNFISFFNFQLKKEYSFSKLVDLKLIESFFGLRQNPPKSLNEALKRLVPFTTNKECKKIHNTLHLPLAQKVVPAMETYGKIIDVSLRKNVYPSYEIEGQSFGRLDCHKSFENCITPHNMGDAQKALLKSGEEDSFFIYFDFRHMEASMLCWLTEDENLGRHFVEYDDIYKGIYQNIIGELCDTEEKRELAKTVFLPIMFGLQPANLSKKIEVSYQEALNMYNAIKTKYKKAWDYMNDHQETAKTGCVIRDHFGRPRTFQESPWKVRGFLVQSASAVFCLEKLIELHKSLAGQGNLIYSIYDGYILSAKKDRLNKVIASGIKTLQDEGKMCAELKLSVACSVGIRLDKLQAIPMKKGYKCP